MLSLKQLANSLGGEVSGNQVLCPGPGHSPRDRSLTVKLADSKLGFITHSHAGDSWERCRDYVRAKIGAEPFKANGKSAPRAAAASSIDKIYAYQDEHGETLFEVLRFKPKDFRQRRPDGKGGHIWSMGSVRRVPYQLPKLLEAIANEQPVFIAEGEKGVDALRGLGLPTTCSPGGAGKWRDEYAEHFKGADVVVLPDNDEPGEKHATHIVQSLSGIATRVRVVRLPGLPEKGDPFDWLTAGGTVEQLWEIVEGSSEAAAETVGPKLITRNAAEIEPEAVEWIWEPRLARGKLTVIAGEPGLGKSQTGIDIAAVITRGGSWPNDEGKAPQGRVLILSAEDDAADTIVPRLIAADADRSKVEILQAVDEGDGKTRRTFNLQTDLHLLEETVKRLGDVQLVLIDPISAYFGKGVDSHNDVAVRGVLAPVAELAARLDIAMLSIQHFNKGNVTGGTKALHKIMGSVAFVAGPRVAFAIIEDAEDNARRLFLHVKNNLAAPPPGLAFSVEQAPIDISGIISSRIAWEADVVTMTADQAISASKAQDTAPALEEAKQFLATIIGSDGMLVKEIEKEAKEAGLSWATVRRAKDELKMRSERDGFAGPWIWKRP